MMYLIGKFTIFFFISATVGFALGSWWSRRTQVVTAEPPESLHELTIRPDQANWTLLWQRLDAIPNTKDLNFESVLQRCDEIADSVSKIPQPKQCDLGGVERRLDSLQAAVADIPIPLRTKVVDLQPVLEKLDLIKQDFQREPR